MVKERRVTKDFVLWTVMVGLSIIKFFHQRLIKL